MYHLENFLGDKFEKIRSIIDNEYIQMNEYINLIGSANYAFPSVLEAMNTPFNLNPSEGNRGNRFFPLCDDIDALENMAEELLQELFHCEDYASNIEAYSGTQANQIVYQSVLKMNDTVIVMAPKAGGHVSHFHYLKTFCNIYTYSVNDLEEIDYDEIDQLCRNYRPKLLIAGTSSYPRNIDYKKISSICKRNNVLLLADISHTAIYIAANKHISPFGYADFVTFTTHKTTRGIRGGIVMCKKEFISKIDHATFPIVQGAPKFNEILAKTVMLAELTSLDITEYVNRILKISNTFIDIFKSQGLKLYTNGSDSHLIVIDLRESSLSGKEGEDLLLKQHVLVNRNQLPNDKRKANVTSGIRIGILTLATLNMPESEYKQIANLLASTITQNRLIDCTLVKEIIKTYRIIN
nr:serine hydroxymethyltransferase [uncultured Schaedlerella sp.]